MGHPGKCRFRQPPHWLLDYEFFFEAFCISFVSDHGPAQLPKPSLKSLRILDTNA